MNREWWSTKLVRPAVVALCLFPWASAGAQRTVRPAKTTVCKILENPKAYDGRMVEFTGTVTRNYEFSVIKYGGCGGIHIAYPGEPELRSRSALFKLVKDAEFDKFEELLSETDSSGVKQGEVMITPAFSYTVTAVFVGRLDAPRSPDRGKTWGPGFGHLNQFPARIVVYRVKEVSGEPLSPADYGVQPR
jgi:hypothetical protein